MINIIINKISRLLSGIGHRMIARIWRLGAGARLFYVGNYLLG